MQMLGRREGMGGGDAPRDSGGGRPAARPAAQQSPASGGFNDVEDDIPF